jgi:hypothetical protein
MVSGWPCALTVIVVVLLSAFVKVVRLPLETGGRQKQSRVGDEIVDGERKISAR